MSHLNVRARVYLACVISAGTSVLGLALVRLDYRSVGATTLLLMLLCLFGDSKANRGANDRASIGLGYVVLLAAFPLVGVWGSVTVAVGNMLAVGTHANLLKRVFNGSQYFLAAAIAATTFVLLGGRPISEGFSVTSALVPLVAAGVVLCAINGTLVAGIVSLSQGVPMRTVWRGTMAHSAVPYLGYGLFGLLLAVLWVPAGIGAFSALLLLLPLHIARWAYAQYAEEQHAYDRTVRTLIAAVETKDLYTRGHSERVAAASVLIARAMKLRDDRVASLRYAGMLHDVGKLGVPTRVLQKSTRLTEEEFAAIQLHPVRGLEMVREIEFLDEAFAGIMHHHERLDGRGYPMGLTGDQIPEFARVIAVADAFDSMTTTRSYRGARTIEEAVAELRRCAGTQFQPEMVEALVAALDEHGWQVETAPMFEPVVELVQPATSAPASFDHDDPTMAPIPRQAVT
jgi:hypothetical protein